MFLVRNEMLRVIILSQFDERQLSLVESDTLIAVLKQRFEKNMHRHLDLVWTKVEAKLKKDTRKLWSLHEMERTGGEPDVITYEQEREEYIFYDCSKESPKGRRSVCYDLEALESRKKFKPENNVIDMVETMGIELLTEEHYRILQQFEAVDLKTSSWIETPENIRDRGGAIFCDRRYDQVFVYHNGAESYYASRGFRGLLKV